MLFFAVLFPHCVKGGIDPALGQGRLGAFRRHLRDQPARHPGPRERDRGGQTGKPGSYDGNHDKCSSGFVRVLLEEYGYTREEIDLICYAIDNHSGRIDVEDAYYYIDNNMVEDSLRDTWAKLLIISDQLSRNCYICKANAICKWLEGEKTNENWKQRIC